MNTRRDFMRGLSGLGAIIATGQAPAAIVRSMVAVRGAMMGGKSGGGDLPYDAEVEYIETDGIDSYVDTGIIPVLVAEHDFSVMSVDFALQEWRPDNTNFVCGARYNNTATTTTFGCAAYDTSAHKIYFFRPTVSASSPLSQIDTYRHSVTMQNGLLVADGTGVSVTRISATTQNATTNFCLGTSGVPSMHPSGVNQFAKARFYSCKIVTGGDTVFEGMPVRKDGCGYIYDRVSGVNIGNAGTGTLGFGPDRVGGRHG